MTGTCKTLLASTTLRTVINAHGRPQKLSMCAGFTLKVFKDNCWLQLLKLNREGIRMKKVRKRQCTRLFTKMSNAILLRIVPLPTMYRLFLTVLAYFLTYWDKSMERNPTLCHISFFCARQEHAATNQQLPMAPWFKSLPLTPSTISFGFSTISCKNTEKNRKLVQISRSERVSRAGSCAVHKQQFYKWNLP